MEILINEMRKCSGKDLLLYKMNGKVLKQFGLCMNAGEWRAILMQQSVNKCWNINIGNLHVQMLHNCLLNHTSGKIPNHLGAFVEHKVQVLLVYLYICLQNYFIRITIRSYEYEQ